MVKKILLTAIAFVLIANESFAALAGGTYTINKSLPASSTNFVSFASAISAMNTGITGNVTFNVVASSGPYIERITIGNISGASATKRIRFNGNGVTVQNNITSTYTGMLMMNGAKYVTIDSINFVSLNSTNGYGAMLYNTCNYDSIIRCTFNISNSSSTSSASSVGMRISTSTSGASTTSSGATNTYIGHNKFLGSTGSGSMYYGMYCYGPNTNNVYENNIVSNFYYYGIYSGYETAVKYIGNTITRETKTVNSVGYYGLYANYPKPGCQFTDNIVRNLGGASNNSSYCYPFNIMYGAGTTASPILVANNSVQNMTSNPTYGYRIYYTNNVNVYHNTLNVDNAISYGGTIYGYYIYACNGVNLKNNIGSITAGGTTTKYGVYYYNNSSITADRNDFYINSSQSGTQYYGYLNTASTTFAAFRAAHPTYEANGKSIDPQFYSVATGNLIPTDTSVRRMGENLTAIVPNDIKKIARRTTPTPGAFEYKLPNDAASNFLVSPSGNVCAGSQPVIVNIKNVGTNNINSVTVNWRFNGTLRTSRVFNRTLIPENGSVGNNTDTVNLGTATLTSGANTIKIWTSNPNGAADPDKENDTIVVTITPASFAVSATFDTVCPISNSVLTLSPSATYTTGALKWQRSSNNSTWTDISGTDNVNYTVAGINASTYYRAQIITGGSGCYSPSKRIIFSDPIVASTTAATRCGSGSVTLKATTSSGNILRWYDVPSGGTLLGTGTNFVTPYLPATDTFYVAATRGCESIRTPVIATITPSTTINASIVTPSTGVLCKGSNALLSVSSSNSRYRYIWSSGHTGSTANVSPQDTSIYLVYAYDSTTNCGAIDTIKLPVRDQIVTITPVAVQTICDGQTKVYNANSGTNLIYQWYKNNTVVTGATSASYTATTAGNYSVLVTHTPTGCSNRSTNAMLNVTPLPNVALLPSGNATLCTGSTLTIAAPSHAVNAYEWYKGSSTTVIGTNSTLNTTTSGAYKVKITANGCSNTSSVVNVSLLPLPTALMTPNTHVEDCDTIELSSQSTGVSYQWYRNGASISGAIDSVFYVTATGDYHVKVTSLSNGCSASTSDVNFSINPSPLVAITYNAPLTFCEGSSVVLNSPYNSNYRYEWSKDGVPYSGNQPNIHASQTGNYSLIITNTHSNCIKRSDTIAVKVLPNPVVTASYTPSTNVLTTSQSYSTYQWFVNSQAIGGATTRNHTPTVNGGYKVQVSDNNGCWGMSDIIFVNELGVASTQLGKSIKIFPNPTSGVLNISATAPVTYKVLDITGKVIVTGDNDKIDMSATTDGAYILLISDKEGQLIRSERITKKSGY